MYVWRMNEDSSDKLMSKQLFIWDGNLNVIIEKIERRTEEERTAKPTFACFIDQCLI